MARLGRLGAAVILTLGTLALVPVLIPVTAFADHCPPPPKPIDPDNNTWCHTPTPTATPEPTSKPSATPAPKSATPAPRTSAPRPVAPVRTPSGNTGTDREPTPFPVEVPAEDPLATPQIIVDGPLDDPTNFEVAEPAGSLSNWFFGFIAGFIIGALIGRASWGIRRKRRQQIFG